MIDDDNKIQAIESSTKDLVSTSIQFDSPSPVLFSNTENTVVLIDAASKKPKELRLPQFNVSMVKTKDNKWELSQKGKVLGTIKTTDQEEERFLKEQFGSHWDQFVIPLESEDGKTTYFMIPYTQNVDKKGRISADQSSMKDIPHPFLITKGSDGNIKGSQASELYLAHRYLLQAEKTRNPTTARELFQKAQRHLENISTSRLPGTPEEVENLKYVMQLIGDHPAISLKPAPTASGLIMTIKMELYLDKIRSRAKAKGVKSLQISPKQELEELSKIANNYQAYKVLSKRKTDKTIEQDLFKLSKKDIATLEGVGQRLLLNISQRIEDAKTETYFGTTGRMATKITLEKPTKLDPQFILALVRMAKPYNSQVSLNRINSPLPLGDLVENFWSYFVSIKEDGLTPEDLIFLFEESIIPPTDSPEQEEHLKALDLQARQYLIGMASLMKKGPGNVDLMKEAEKGVNGAKEQIKEIKTEGDFHYLINLYKGNPDLGTNFEKVIAAVESLEVEALPDSDPEMPDLLTMSMDLKRIKSSVENLKESLEKSLDDATKLINNTNSEYKNLTSTLQKSKKDLKSAQTERELKIKDLEQKYSENSIAENITEINKKAEEQIKKLEGEKKSIGLEAKRELQEKEDLERQIDELQTNAKKETREIEGLYLGKPLTDKKKEIETKTNEKTQKLEKEINTIDDKIKRIQGIKEEEIDKQIDKVNKEKEERISKLREDYSKENFEKDAEVIKKESDAEIMELTNKVMRESAKLETFLKKEFNDPVTGEKLVNGLIIDGSYAKTIQLDKLKTSVSKTENMVKELDENVKEMKEGADLLEQWNQLEKQIGDVEHLVAPPRSWFTLPSKGAAREFIEYSMKGDGDSPPNGPPSTFQAGLSMIKQMGVVDTLKLANAKKNHADLVARRDLIESELDKKVGDKEDEITEAKKEELEQELEEVRQKILNTPIGVTVLAGRALGTIQIASEFIPGNRFECQPEGVADHTASTERLKVSEVLDNELAQQCFTPEQLESLQENLLNLPQEEQLSYIEQLSLALMMNSSTVEAQTGLRTNISTISTAHSNRTTNLQQGAASPTHDFSGKVQGESKKERYQEFFKGKAEFADNTKTPVIFAQLKDQIQGQPKLEYLKEKINNLENLDIEVLKENLSPVPPEVIPYIEALELIVDAHKNHNNETQAFTSTFLQKVSNTQTGDQLLLDIQSTYQEIAPILDEKNHKRFVDELKKKTLPEDSLYSDDLSKGFDKIQKENPLAYSAVVGEDKVNEVARAIEEDVANLSEEIEKEEQEIIACLKKVPLNQLPKSLQKVRMRRGNDVEILQAAFKEYRKGSFDSFETEPLGIDQLSLDALIGKCLIDRTRKDLLKGAHFNATKSVERLRKLLEEKREIEQKIREAPDKQNKIQQEIDQLNNGIVEEEIPLPENLQKVIDIPEGFEDAYKLLLRAVMNNSVKSPEDNPVIGTVYKIDEKYTIYIAFEGHINTLVPISVDSITVKNNIKTIKKEFTDRLIRDKRQELDSHDVEKLQSQLDAVNSTWKKESKNLNDFTDRCQSSEHLTNLPDSLKPYGRHINYLQEKMGLVLREDQIETLVEIIENPALLKQLRMGLGKTSIIVPFALMILGAKGHNTIGMVPRALFTTNFDEMDDTTRTVFELSGNQFLFSRQDATFPLNTASLHQLSEKCANFFRSLERGEYILTTIESKASLDNKISELERSQALIQDNIDMLKQDEESDHAEEINLLFPGLVAHQTALDMLYRVKDIFEADRTRLIIDEVDSVAKANYSVNSESGVKTPIRDDIQEVAVDIFDAIRKNSKMQETFTKVKENNQFTLDEEEVNEVIRDIGEILIEGYFEDYPGLKDKKEDILKWFAGQRDCPYSLSELQQLGPLKNKITIMRKALNSGLRSSLGLKVGLSCDFDPTHGAIGVPASQGVTSKTTKYSDPLMQVILTQMIALYKPQGEAFLRASSLEVIEEMKKEVHFIDSVLQNPNLPIETRNSLEKKKEEIEDGIFKLSKLMTPQGFLKELQVNLRDIEAQIEDKKSDELSDQEDKLKRQINELEEYINNYDDESPPNLEKEIDGDAPIDIFLRQRFAQQVAKQAKIYVSTSEMSRPVQHTLRGCNVIGLTGTATRNTEHVITSTGHDEALEGVTKAGRETTAEVVYRVVKAQTRKGKSPEQTLENPVKTYPSKSKAAFDLFVRLAQKDSGYRFIINQAGCCDHMSLRDIANGLHKQTDRPIIYLDMDEDGRTEKVALINGVRKPLTRLSDAEKELVNEEGFFYYHTPHVRGTHFPIPPGSRGALMNSPKVNANDSGQANYRARLLGEGHDVDPFISEKQADEFKRNNNGKNMSLGDMLKVQHEQTRKDEAQEDLSAYTLHIKGIVTLAADRVKKNLQLKEGTVKQVGDWMLEADREQNLEKIEARVEAFRILEKMFTKDTGNEAYLRLLRSEISQGGTKNTKDYLCQDVIPGEIARIDRYLEQLKEIEVEEKPELEKAIKLIEEELSDAKDMLQLEAKKIEDSWKSLEKQLPKETSSAPATQETAETEAEAEAEAVAETTSETEAETERRRRKLKTKGILQVPDEDLLRQLEGHATKLTIPAALLRVTYDTYHEGIQKDYLPRLWRDDRLITPRLKHILKEASLGQPPQIKAFIMETDNEPVIVLTDAGDANQLTGHLSYTLNARQVGNYSEEAFTANTYSVTPVTDKLGMIELKYGGTGNFGQSRRVNFKESSELKGNIYFSLLIVGYTMISEEGWNDMEKAWESLNEDDRQALRAELEKLSKNTLDKAALHLWNKPKEEVI